VTTPEGAAVALELERLRGAVETGFARVDGRLELLVQRSNQTDRRVDDHEVRLDVVERGRWPLASVSALAAVAVVGVAVWEGLAR
jgi:hypothetical protein